MSSPKLLAGLAVTGLFLAACGGGGGGNPQTIKGTIKIGIDLPVSGADASDGQPTQNGAKLAVKQAGKVCGASSHTDACFTLQSVPLDDAVNGVHDPAQGAKNVQSFIADAAVLGMVGPFNSNVARAEMPIANAASLTMVSPSNTNECLTKDIPSCKEEFKKYRPTGKVNYFRVCTTDDIQGPAAADFAYKKLNKTKVFVVNDQQTYGLGIAKNFAAQWVKDGGTVVNPDLGGFDPSSTTPDAFKSLLSRAKGKADIVFFGGTTSDKGGVIRKQMKDVLPGIPYIAGDGISGNQFAKDAQDNAADSYFTVAGPYAPKLDTAQKFVADYKAEYGSDVGAYSAQGYDAAGVIIGAIRRAIDDAGGNMPTREQVVSEMLKTKDYKGSIGTTNFDQNGDTTLKLITIYKWTSATDENGTFVDQVAVS